MLLQSQVMEYHQIPVSSSTLPKVLKYLDPLTNKECVAVQSPEAFIEDDYVLYSLHREHPVVECFLLLGDVVWDTQKNESVLNLPAFPNSVLFKDALDEFTRLMRMDECQQNSD